MRVHALPKGICPKVNVIARLEYGLAYYDSALRRFNHYTTSTPPHRLNPNRYDKTVVVYLGEMSTKE